MSGCYNRTWMVILGLILVAPSRGSIRFAGGRLVGGRRGAGLTTGVGHARVTRGVWDGAGIVGLRRRAGESVAGLG